MRRRSSSISSSKLPVWLFAIRTLAFLAAQVGLILLVALLFYRPDRHDYLGASIDKHVRLASAPSPRAIFVGASNVAFSLDGRIIRDVSACHPVNMGLARPLGLAFMLAEIRSSVRPGDVVVVSLPYEVFTAAGARGNSHEVLRTLERNPTLLTRLGLSDLLVVSQENDWLFGYLGRVIRASAASALRLPKKYDPVIPQLREAVFVRASFNEFGDHVGHWSVPQAPDVKASPIPTDYWPRTVSRLVEFEEFLTTRGVRLFYAFPAIPSDVYADPSSRRFIDKVAGGLRRAGVRAINRPEEVVLPPEAFLDSTGKHPMRAGVETYSQLVAERLRTAESCLPRH